MTYRLIFRAWLRLTEWLGFDEVFVDSDSLCDEHLHVELSGPRFGKLTQFPADGWRKG